MSINTEAPSIILPTSGHWQVWNWCVWWVMTRSSWFPSLGWSSQVLPALVPRHHQKVPSPPQPLGPAQATTATLCPHWLPACTQCYSSFLLLPVFSLLSLLNSLNFYLLKAHLPSSGVSIVCSFLQSPNASLTLFNFQALSNTAVVLN